MNLQQIDQIKRRVIVAIFSDDVLLEHLVLKGGNVLDLVYMLNHRASLDLDFSIAGDFPGGNSEVSKRLTNTLIRTFAEAGYSVFDIEFEETPPGLTADLASFWGGYKLAFKLIEAAKQNLPIERRRREATVVGPGQVKRFFVDISKHEYCAKKKAVDMDGFRIYVYTPEMVACEKLRAICQQLPEYVTMVSSHNRPRPRDFFDIYRTVEHFKFDLCSTENLEMLRAVFAAKKVPLELLQKIGQTQDFHAQGFEELRATVRNEVKLRDFGFYFAYVVRLCNVLGNELGFTSL